MFYNIGVFVTKVFSCEFCSLNTTLLGFSIVEIVYDNRERRTSLKHDFYYKENIDQQLEVHQSSKKWIDDPTSSSGIN